MALGDRQHGNRQNPKGVLSPQMPYTMRLDGFATAAEQLCGRSTGAHDRAAFSRAVRLVLAWGFAFGLATTAVFVAVATSTLTAANVGIGIPDQSRIPAR